MKNVFLAVAAALALSACATAIPHLSPGQLQWAAARWPETTQEQLEHGRSLYLARCSACHAPPQPGFSTKILASEMGQRARLSGEEQKLVLRFLEATRAVGQVAER